MTADDQPFATPATLDGWMALFSAGTLPVLAETAAELEYWRVREDDADAHTLAEAFAGDPLMSIKVLAHVAQLRAGRRAEREGGDTETLLEALVMLGISPFFRAFGPQPTVEEALAANPAALAGFRRVLLRSRRAAQFAMAFAVHRMDHDAGVIHDAALLHHFGELLLWWRAPVLALQIQQRQQADAALRSAAVQRAVLHLELPDLEHALMQAWGLPRLLLQITDEHAPRGNAQLRTVQLALRVARHSANGWDNPALPDDLHEGAALLSLSPDAVQRLLHDVDPADGEADPAS